MSLLAAFTTIFGIIMAFGYFPQAWKMFKTRSVKDISPLSFWIFFIGNCTWWFYGFSINDWPLKISPAVGILGSGLVLSLYYLFKQKEY